MSTKRSPDSATGGRDDARRRAATVRRLERATGALANAAIERMEQNLRWYRNMPAENRSWVGLVAQAGVAAFTEWFRHPESHRAISADVFGTAPRELTRAVTLQQTVEMVRTTIEVVEERIDAIAGSPAEATVLREAVLRYSREIAFAAAGVYARAAELRGAWDARLEALVVDALLREEADDSLRSRAAALGWTAHSDVVVTVGFAPAGDADSIIDGVRRAARHAHLSVLAGVQGDRLVVILGGATEPLSATRALTAQFAAGPVVVGPAVADLLAASRSARAALAGLRAAPAWPDAPRPVLAAELLPERALAGDPAARTQLVEEIYRPLHQAGTSVMETLAVYLEQANSLEGAARMLFVHPNTVRYRLRRVTDVTGLVPTQSRAAFTLRVALALGRLTLPKDEL